MNILICHERFLFRFGADRVLILLGKGLSEMGHNMTLMGTRFEKDSIESFASEIIVSPVASHCIDSNESTRNWLQTDWNRIFSDGNTPDVVIVGGWPYISAISFFRQVCRQVIFVDFGVVPNEGYSEQMITILEKLRAVRRQHLRDASLIIGISRFIAESQSRPDSNNMVPIEPILLGADHLDASAWMPAQFRAGSPDRPALNAVRALKSQGKKVILCLGRWEPGCYKNSEAALDVIQSLRSLHSDCILLVLEQASNIQIPDHLKERIFPVGFPDDQELIEIMKQADLGLSVSFWEGFNLPLAEMQWFGRPVLALNVGAHPEVILNSWYLCRDLTEMVAKAAELLDGGGPEKPILAESLERFRSHFRWERFVDAYCKILDGRAELFDKHTIPSGLLPAKMETAVLLKDGPISDSRKRVLYPNCLCESWQMNDSERLALTGLLSRHQPHCSIEVGTYHGGSLSLISQYSKMVFSIDIDGTIPSRFSFPNVSFLTGRSHLILPHLFDELDKAGVPLEFMLIDGEHSAAGVKGDIGCLVGYAPKKPLFVALHDSFNPDCRQGMLDAGWERSPYCHWVDLDFVPGKMGTRELWGGLALAYFLPVTRSGPLEIGRAAEEMFQALNARQVNATDPR